MRRRGAPVHPLEDALRPAPRARELTVVSYEVQIRLRRQCEVILAVLGVDAGQQLLDKLDEVWR